MLKEFRICDMCGFNEDKTFKLGQKLYSLIMILEGEYVGIEYELELCSEHYNVLVKTAKLGKLLEAEEVEEDSNDQDDSSESE